MYSNTCQETLLKSSLAWLHTSSFYCFSRLLISNNLNLSPSYNNSDYEITSKCFTASVSLLNQHLEMFSSSENYKYFTCSMFCSSYHCACYGCWDCCATLLCMIDTLFLSSVLSHLPSPEQHSQTQGKPPLRLWWCWWPMRFIPFSSKCLFSCRVAFPFHCVS